MLKEIRRFFGRDPNFQSVLCFGQDGEDLMLDRLLEKQGNGFYVDVGAHHPVRFSNTYLFYLRGWRGINIDAEPGSMRLFQKYRPRDINVECGIASRAGKLTYFRFNEPALNTFCEGEAKLKDAAPYRIIERVQVGVRRLEEILNEYLTVGQPIDFLSVDVEGMDTEVLKSNDWARYRPRFVLAETLRTDILSLAASPTTQLLGDVGYKPIAKAYNTTFFERVDS